MEQLRERLYLDGAHNENGTQAFLECVRTQKAARRVLLYSVVKDEQYVDSIRMLADSKLFDLVYLVQLQGSRALAPKDMEEILAQCGTDTMIVSTVEQGLLKLKEEIQAGATAYIVGSLYLAGEVLAAMEKRKND